MPDTDLQHDAARLECLLPKIMRRLFTLEHDHPAAELPVAQLRVCTILQGGPRPLSAISEELSTSVSAVTQLADRLERAGFVERVTEGEDRRIRHLKLTEQGAALMALRRQTRIEQAAEALSRLSPEEREAVLRALEQLACAAPEPAGAPEDPLALRAQV